MKIQEIKNALYCMKTYTEEEICPDCPLYGKTGTDHCDKDSHRIAIEILEKELAKLENKPLTFEELLEIDDTQVWFSCEEEEICYKVIIDDINDFKTTYTPHFKRTRGLPTSIKNRWSVLTKQVEKGYFKFYRYKPNLGGD